MSCKCRCSVGVSVLKLDTYLQHSVKHLAMLKIFIQSCPVSVGMIRSFARSPTIAIFGLYNLCVQGSHGFWKVLEFERFPGMFWKNFYEKSWKSPGILHNTCPMYFLFRVVYNEFSPSCYVRYSTSFFSRLFTCF